VYAGWVKALGWRGVGGGGLGSPPTANKECE